MSIFSSFPAAAELTPGKYMHQCRRRSGKSIGKCAKEIALHVGDQAKARCDLEDLEADRPGDYARLVDHLHKRQVFQFDPFTFAALAAATADPSLDEWADI